MNSICERMIGQLLLWHATDPIEQAESIAREGFRLSRKPPRHGHREQATWFFHATAFGTGEMTERPVGFVVAVDPDEYVRGRDYAHEMDDIVIFHVPLPADLILARLDLARIVSREALAEALSDRWQCDVISEFAECCSNPEIPWSQKHRVAEMLWSLAPARYFGAGVLHHLLAAEVPGLSLTESAHLASLLREACPRFLDELLRLYHRVFLTPHFARAAMVAAARHLRPDRVLALAEGPATDDASSPEDAAVAEFLSAALPGLPAGDLVRGAIELASMRHFPGDREDIQSIADWVARRADEAEETAFHYVMFAGDSFPSRHAPHVARELALRILQATGKDYFDRLLSLGETDYPETLFGVMHGFAALGDERAVPFLASRLKDDRKQQRAAAVQALGQIGTPEALAAIETVANDKAKIVKRAVQQALGKP